MVIRPLLPLVPAPILHGIPATIRASPTMCNHIGNKGSGFCRTKAALPLYSSTKDQSFDCSISSAFILYPYIPLYRPFSFAPYGMTVVLLIDSVGPAVLVYRCASFPNVKPTYNEMRCRDLKVTLRLAHCNWEMGAGRRCLANSHEHRREGQWEVSMLSVSFIMSASVRNASIVSNSSTGHVHRSAAVYEASS